MTIELFINQNIETYSSSPLPNGWQYFFLFLLFFLIIFSIIVVIYFAKWLTMGPKLKARWAKITGKGKKVESVDGVKLKGKEIIIDSNYEEELKRKILESTSPQEKLEYQNKLDKHIKQKNKAEKEIREIEKAKLLKIEEKEEKARIQKEAKEEAKKIKEKEKLAKKESKLNIADKKGKN